MAEDDRKKNIDKPDQERVNGEGDPEDFAQVPSPSDGDAVKEALDIAQSFGALRERKESASAFQISNFDDSVSLSEYIDEAEKKSQPLFDSENIDHAPVEDLEILSIAAEFGRPDDSNEEVSDPEHGEESAHGEEPDEPIEDTKDLTLKSKIPRSNADDGEDSKAGGRKIGTELMSTTSKEKSLSEIDVEGNTESLSSAHIETSLSLTAGATSDFGDLAASPLFDLLLGIYKEKRTGVLILKQQQTVCRLFTYEGDVVMAESSSNEQGLENWLRQEGYIDSQTYSDLLRETSSLNTFQRSAAIVSRGIVGPREMNRLMRKYYEHIVISATAWTTGTWRFEKSARVAPGDTSVMIEASTPGLIYHGITKHAEMTTVRTLVPEWSKLRHTGRGICRLQELDIDDVGRLLLSACDGTSEVWQRVVASEFEKDRYHRLLVALFKLGFVEVLEVDRISDRVTPEPWKDAAVESSLRKPLTAISSSMPTAPLPSSSEPSPMMMRELVSQKLRTVREGSYYDILEVEPDASSVALEEARGALLDLFDWERFSYNGLLDLDADVQLIRYIIEEAHRVLTHPVIAEKYRSAETGDDVNRRQS